MAENPEDIALGFADDGAPAVFVGAVAHTTAAALADAVPWLLTAPHAARAAEALNHLAFELTYKVIDDPAVFAAWYRARYAAEPEGEVQPYGGFGLRQFGMPDLDSITAPRIDGGTLVFYAVNRQLGAPYRVTMPLAPPGPPDYDPMPMAAEG